MLDKYDKIRKERWGKRNSIQDNKDYIKTLLKQNNFKTYHFMIDGYGDEALEITHGLEEFKIEVDKDGSCYKIFKRNESLNPRKKEKYRFIKDFKCDDILELLLYIKEQNIMNIKKCN